MKGNITLVFMGQVEEESQRRRTEEKQGAGGRETPGRGRGRPH